MRIRSTGLALFAGLSIFVAACSNGGAEFVTGGIDRPDDGTFGRRVGPGIRPGAERRRSRTSRSASSPTSARSTTRTSTSSPSSARSEGAAADRCRAAARSSSRRPTSDYAPLIQAFVDQDFDVIVAAGFNLVPADRGRGQGQPRHLVHRRRPRPVHQRDGRRRSDVRGLLRRRRDAAAELHRAQLRRGPGGLPRRHRRRPRPASPASSAPSAASRCAARASATSRATSSAPSRSTRTSGRQVGVRHGQRLPASASPTRRPARRSVTSSSRRTPASTSCSRSPARPATAIIDAACAAGINAIGVDVDQHAVVSRLRGLHPDERREEPRPVGLRLDPAASPTGTAKGGLTFFNADQRRHRRLAVLRCGEQARRPTSRPSSTTALAGMKAGTLTTCPANVRPAPGLAARSPIRAPL